MKVMQTLIVCTNMKNIHILKLYIGVILVSGISSMHAYPQKHPYNTKQTQINTHGTSPHCLNPNDIDSDHGTEETIKTFPTMLKLIGGTLVGGVKYSDLYIDSNEDEDTSSANSYVIMTKAMTRTTFNTKYQHYHK